MELSKPTNKKYWIAYGAEVYHVGETNPNQVTTTGQKNFETFDTEEARNARFKELTGRTKVESYAKRKV